MKKYLKFLRAFIGRFIITVLLTVIYILTVLPIGLIMRIFGRDRLWLKKPRAETYWKKADDKVKGYEFQF